MKSLSQLIGAPSALGAWKRRGPRGTAARTWQRELADIKILLEWENLPDEACPDVQELLKERIGELDAKIREMRSFSKSLKRLLSACEESCDARCAVLEEFGKVDFPKKK
ncbi:hypothetical protein VDG1235_4441 [Verrucomicrobiia bacterium DG1235]|nr:hypothetical protein VDG1235_4441 [Verrucomicrobiae bacterium DG1235]